MLGLVLKDFRVSRTILAVLLPFYALYLATFVRAPALFLFMTLVVSALLAMGGVAWDFRYDQDALWCSLPVERRTVVRARYLVAALGALLGVGTSFLVGFAVRVLLNHTAEEGDRAMIPPSVFVATFLLLLLMTSLFLPFYFRLGAGKGLFAFSSAAIGILLAGALLAQVAALLLGASNPLFDPEAWKSAGEVLARRQRAGVLSIEAALRLGIPILIGFLYLFSMRVSERFYDSRDL